MYNESVDKRVTKLTGAQQIQDYSQALSTQLQRMAERLGLDTAETEALMQWVSTVMATPSLSIAELQKMLMSGLKEFDWITSESKVEDGLLSAMLQAQPLVRYAAVIRRPGATARVVAYLGRW